MSLRKLVIGLSPEAEWSPQQNAMVGLSMKLSTLDPHFLYFDGGEPQVPYCPIIFAQSSAISLQIDCLQLGADGYKSQTETSTKPWGTVAIQSGQDETMGPKPVTCGHATRS